MPGLVHTLIVVPGEHVAPGGGTHPFHPPTPTHGETKRLAATNVKRM
jgi:hypothetical protein